MNPWARLTIRLHRKLARSFPHEFQMRHGDDLERMGDDAATYIGQRYGVLGLLRLLMDEALRIVVEYLEEVRDDVKHAFRRLRSSPGFTAIGVLSLALSIGMCSLFYLQMSAMAGAAPGVRDPGTLVAPASPVSYPYFERYREQDGVVSAAAAFLGPTPFTVGVGSAEANRQRIFGHLVSPEYFSTLGVNPSAGRFFDPKTERPGSQFTVVVGHRFWQTYLNSDTHTVGKELRVNGRPALIIGVAPRGFRGAYPLTPAELYVPVTVDASVAPELKNDVLRDQDAPRFRALLRLAEGVTMPEAEAALQVVTRVLDEQKPESERPREERTLTLIEAGVVLPVRAEDRKIIYGINGFLFAMILAIACSNLAVLLLARGGERRKEVAIRLSVGASRFRIVRQVLTESVTLALAGGFAGILVSYWLLRLQSSVPLPTPVPMELGFQFDWGTVWFAICISILAGLGFGLVPALASVRRDLVPVLKEGAQDRLRTYRRFGIRNQFMVFQLSGSLMLLLITGYIVWGYQRSCRVDPGFDTDNLYLLALDPARDGYSVKESAELLERVPGRLERLDEVRSVALSLDLPFSQAVVTPNWQITVPPLPPPGGDGPEEEALDVVHGVVRQRIGAGYFKALGVPLVRGREFLGREQFDPTDEQETSVILNQIAADRLFGGSDPIGRAVRDGDRSYVVVGIAPDLKSGLMMGAPAPTAFVPLTGDSFGGGSLQGTAVILRAVPGSAAMEAAIRELASFGSNLTVFNARSFNEDLQQFNVLMRWGSFMNGSLGAFGLILGLIGLFGVTAHTVTRRRKEIGIRLALGAPRNNVLRLVLREGAVLVVTGGVLGFAGAYLFSRAFSAVASGLAEVFAVGTDDPVMVFGAPLAWATLAMVTCYLPARRSIRIDPASTLRTE